MSNAVPRYRDILDTLNTAIIALDTADTILYLNPAAEHFLGSSLTKNQQLILDGMFAIHPTEATERPFRDYSHPSRKNQQTYIYREMRIRFPDNHECKINCCVSPFYQNNNIQGCIFEINSIDRILQISREEQLSNQYSTAREIVRGLAHEINNPLGGLRGAAQLLEKDLPDPALKEYTRIIIDEADRLQNLVKRMLGPDTLPHNSITDIHDVLDHIQTLVRIESNQGIQFKTDYDPSIPPLQVDRDHILQAILNIIRNAAQALSEHGNITLRTRPSRNFCIGKTLHKLALRLDIIDDGPGIPDNMQNYIFYPMISSKPGGSGLGLSIAQSLITLHGGLIEFESRSGHTCFTLYLPINTHYS